MTKRSRPKAVTKSDVVTVPDATVVDATPSTVSRQKPVTFVLGQMAEYAGGVVEVIGRAENYELVVRDRAGQIHVVNALHLTTVDAGLSPSEHRETRQRGIKALASQRATVIEPLSALALPTANDYKVAAGKLSLSTRQLRRLVNEFKAIGTTEALVLGRPGRKAGTIMIKAEVEALVEGIISKQLRISVDISVADVYPLIERDCARVLNLPAPSVHTIERRLNVLRQRRDLVPKEVARKQREESRLIEDHYEVTDSLAVVEIDHTPGDVMVVDARDRKPVGRATLTVAIDIATRCVLGIHLGFEAPSSLVVALCLIHAVRRKNEWLQSLDIAHPWPMHGLMKVLHCDNAKEFRAVALADGCNHFSIDLQWRPPATPRFGGHIERYLGTLAKKLHSLPGTTYSEALKGRPENVEGDAALTLEELTRVIARLIIRYHNTTHRVLGCTPQTAWERRWPKDDSTAVPLLPIDQREFFLRLLPRIPRVVTREGIRLFGLEYASESLRGLVENRTKRIIRYDPRDISRIYVQQQEGTYIDVPLRDQRIPNFSLLEWREVQSRDRSFGPLRNPYLIAELITENQLIVDNAKTLRDRKRRARQASWQQQFSASATTPGSLADEAAASDAEYDIASLPSFEIEWSEDV